MNQENLIDLLEQIKSVKVENINDSNQIIVETNLNDYKLNIDCENVEDAQFIISPMDEECLQIFYSNGGGIVVTPNDFVFNVVQEGLIQVDDLPPMCSMKEMITGFEHYRKNPCPSDDIDNNVALFYLHFYIFNSAIAKGFSVPMADDLYNIGNENGFIL